MNLIKTRGKNLALIWRNLIKVIMLKVTPNNLLPDAFIQFLLFIKTFQSNTGKTILLLIFFVSSSILWAPYIPSPPVQCVWGWLSGGMIQLWQGKEVEVLVQQAAVFFCTITCSIIVLWITSIAGDNRQAVKRSGWHRTLASLWETVWIISCLPADCLWGVWQWAVMCGQGSGSFSAVTQSGSQHIQDDFSESQWVTL